jgi:hypothetical protein
MNGLKSTPAQRWLARLSFVLAGLAIVILLVFTGLKSLAMVAVGLAAAVVGLAAARPSAQAPICSASPGATERRPWWPASPPSTASAPMYRGSRSASTASRS